MCFKAHKDAADLAAKAIAAAKAVEAELSTESETEGMRRNQWNLKYQWHIQKTSCKKHSSFFVRYLLIDIARTNCWLSFAWYCIALGHVDCWQQTHHMLRGLWGLVLITSSKFSIADSIMSWSLGLNPEGTDFREIHRRTFFEIWNTFFSIASLGVVDGLTQQINEVLEQFLSTWVIIEPVGESSSVLF